MTDSSRPSILEQIAAVEAAEMAARRYLTMAEHSVEHGDELEAVFAALEAAAETLRTLDFGREIAR